MKTRITLCAAASGLAVCLVQCPSAWAEESLPPDALSYDYIALGYFNAPEEKGSGIGGLSGIGAAASWEPAPRFVVNLGLEHAGADVDAALFEDPAVRKADISGTAITATVGTYFPLSRSVHLTLDVGTDYESAELDAGIYSAQQDQWFGNAIAGLRFKASPRLELAAQMQRLEDFSSDDQSRWVATGLGAYAISDRIDLAVSVGYEDDSPHYLFGARVRF